MRSRSITNGLGSVSNSDAIYASVGFAFAVEEAYAPAASITIFYLASVSGFRGSGSTMNGLESPMNGARS
jgi:hypothetical protein